MNNKKVKKIISIIAMITVVLLLIALYLYKNHNATISQDTHQSASASKGEAKDSTSNSAAPDPNSNNKDEGIETDQPINFQSVSAENKPIIVNFGSEGCPPCRKFKPILQSLSDEYGDKLYIRYIDVWKHPELQGDFQFEYIPSQVIFNKDGSPYVPSQELIDNFQFQIIKNKEGKHIYTLHQGPLPEEVLTGIIKEMI